MAENPHYKELLQLLNEFEVEYLIVGGFAVMKYSEPRYTKDLDVWVHNSRQNSLRVVEALKKFGAPLDHDKVTAETFTDKQGLSDRNCSGPHRRSHRNHGRQVFRSVEKEGRKHFFRHPGALHFP